jgi:glycosyltransferase involved in cell wall biosynthesis
VETGRLVLGVETHAMRRALESLIGMRVVYLPHPVQAAKPPRTDIEGLRTEDGDQRSEALDSGLSTLDSKTPATSNSLPATAAKPLIFGCYGAARWEKGSDIFQEAIKLILSNEVASKKCRVASLEDEPQLVTRDPLPVTAAERPFRFCIQWVEDFREDSGNLVSINPWLREHPQVEVIGRYFEGNEYEQRLAQTDVMVLPYRKPYQLRVSRVVIEAMLNGMPVIAARGTTLFEQAEEYGIVVGCEEGNAESLAGAMLEVAESFESLRMSAAEKMNTAVGSFSVACFRKIVMKSSYEKK